MFWPAILWAQPAAEKLAADRPLVERAAPGAGSTASKDPETSGGSPDQPMAGQIAELIEMLGNDLYATRRQAQDALQMIGVPALDQLQQASLHPDPQIAQAARYLIASSFTNWTEESDPIEVRKLLEHYGTGDLAYREDRILRLLALKDERGLPALLRIVRFEVSGRLARRAALAILRAHTRPRLDGVSNADQTVWAMIQNSAVAGRSDACRWLTEFASNALAEQPFQPAWWKQAVEREQRLLREKSSETSRETVVDLTRFAAEQMLENSQPAMAKELAASLLKIEYLERERLPKAFDYCEWAMQRGFHELAIEQLDQAWFQLYRHAQLDYLRAEAHTALRQSEEASRYAERAFRRGEPTDQPGVALDNRVVHARFLTFRKQYAWAEREYRAAIETISVYDRFSLEPIRDLAALLADGLDYAAAAAVLQPLIERFEKDVMFAKEIDSDFEDDRDDIFGVPAPSFTKQLRATYLFYRAKAKIASGELETAKPDLREAVQLYPENIDVAITMWKHRDDEAWNREGDQRIAEAIERFREALPRLERKSRLNHNRHEFATNLQLYTIALNTYAWLLACTERELEAALEASQRACQLQPNNAAYLDTLARCYFQSGQIDEAVRIQKKAVAIEPFSREIIRTLEEYQAALPKTG
jgi:tetratricopeptide (TPR) repeat protein